jgi:hypothetical protein
LTENPIIIEDGDDNGDLMDRSDHTSHQMTVNDLGVESENTDRHASGAVLAGEGVANSDPDDAATSQGDDHLWVTGPASFSPEIPESDYATTLDEERQPIPFMQGDSIPSPSSKRSRSISGSVQSDGCSSELIVDGFAKDDGGVEGDGLPPSKRVRPSLPLMKAADNRSSPATALAVEDLRDDQGYRVQRIIGESESKFNVTVVTNIWLAKPLVDPKLVRYYERGQSMSGCDQM